MGGSLRTLVQVLRRMRLRAAVTVQDTGALGLKIRWPSLEIFSIEMRFDLSIALELRIQTASRATIPVHVLD